MKKTYVVTSCDKKIKDWLRDNSFNLDYNQLQSYLRRKDITVNKNKIDSHAIVKKGDVVQIWDKIPQLPYTFSAHVPTWNGNDCIFKNDDLFVINKPYGLSTQGDKHDSAFLRVQNLFVKQKIRVHTIHRLDKVTTGTLIFALKRDMAKQLCESISTWRKKYIAILPKTSLLEGIRESFESDKQLVTKYKIIGHYDQFSLATFELVTGRKHQIRKHCAQLGFPIVGDTLYGSNYNVQTCLHCYAIYIPHLTFTFRSNLPDHMVNLYPNIANYMASI
ncbi:MAG: RluA family pseudouridine synthase [Alphaproteobacteria bacterium]|nr:MAG: RluA family pseudouridine synthase [Alphaproteobacteria bacterium]